MSNREPKNYKLLLRSDSTQAPIYIATISRAESFLSRFYGLMGAKRLEDDRGLLIAGCKQVHMCFVGFPIDLVFCDSSQRVVATQAGLKPWSISRYCRQAESVVELGFGVISKFEI